MKTQLHLGLIIAFFLSFFYGYAQTHSIKGEIRDQTTNQPLVGAAAILYQDSVNIRAAISDPDGYFLLDGLDIGRYYIKVQYMGYETKWVTDVYVRSGNQTYLVIHLQESSFTLDEITVTYTEMKGNAQDDFTVLSARTFSIDETERYAGSRGDPARMAANYAGVVGNNDNSNDIVVRGNTPIGLLWRMDNVNIPNPNHFAAAGNSGGPVTILNNQTLANSDFLTGAFPSGYGNTVAGVFDLKSRNGNNSDYEYSGEIGFLGLKARAEGPFSKNGKSSFLAAYRYSTLAAFEFMNVDIGTDDVPHYQDLNMKFNFPLKNGGNIGVFAVGGMSKIDILYSENENPFDGSYGDPNVDSYFRTKMGVTGINYSKSVGKSGYLQLTGSYAIDASENHELHLTWDTLSSPAQVVDFRTKLRYKFQQEKMGLAAFMKYRLSTRSNIKFGFYADYYRFYFHDSIRTNLDSVFNVRLNYDGNGLLLQPYVNWKYDITEKLDVVLGLHGQYWDVSSSISVEPRIAFSYRVDENQTLSFGAGLHSQMLPTYVYFIQEKDQMGNAHLINKEVDFLRSLHIVLGYNRMITSNIRMRSEVYYQYLYNAPVSVKPDSYSILNEGADGNRFFPDSLKNTGTGTNYGLELTLEKFFSQDYFVLFTGSVFSSTYEASDGKTYNTLFNSRYALNLLGAKEFFFGQANNKKLTVGAKITWAGGRWYTPLDMAASKLNGSSVYDNSQRNSLQFNDYFRFDLNIKYRIDKNNLGHEFGLDLVNLFDIENAFRLEYNSFLDEQYFENQLGFLPIFYYRIDF